jgi:hypothetical protein
MPGFDTSEFQAKLRVAQQKKLEAARHGLDEFTAAVIGDAAERAPVGGGVFSPNDPAPGTLKASATQTPAVIQGDGVTAECGFNTVYAARQHEELEFSHDQGEAKYLENALREKTAKLGPFIADKMKAVES